MVEKFVMQLEAQLADRNVTIELAEEASKWLIEHGYDEQMGARPMARVIQEYIKKPLADDVLFGRLKNGGHVRVIVKKDETGRDTLGFEYPEGPVTPKQEKLPEPRKNRAKRRSVAAQAAPAGSERRHAAGRTRLGAESAAEGLGIAELMRPRGTSRGAAV